MAAEALLLEQLASGEVPVEELRERAARLLNKESEAPSAVDLALFFSNPLVARLGDGSLVDVDGLAQVREQRLLKDSIKESRHAVCVRSYRGTTDAFRVLLGNGCSILHFSGHGLVDEQGRDLLVFEDADAGAHLCDMATLARLLEHSPPSLRLVVLAACNSQSIAQVFLDHCGEALQHVVCVRREHRVRDDSMLVFSRAFYHALFTGAPVESAFEIGCGRVAAESGVPAAESEKFVLCRRQTGSISKLPLLDVQAGRWRDITPKPFFRRLPARAHTLLGRNFDLFQVIQLVNRHRLVTIRGPPGIGKTSVAKALAHFVLKQSAQFDDGVAYCSFRGCQTVADVFHTLAHALSSAADETTDTVTTKPAALRDARDTVVRLLGGRHVLLVLDNAEDAQYTCGADKFRDVLSYILERAEGTSMVLTSRLSLGGGMPDRPEKVYSLGPLEPRAAALLFDQHCPRPITVEDLELEPPSSSSATQHQQQHEDALMLLAMHPVLVFLGGHPHSIALAAPLLQDRTLSELQSLLETRSIDALQLVGTRPEEQSTVNTLVASIQASIAQLPEETVRFFLLFGLLPSGALAADLEQIWGRGWEDHAALLFHASLIVRTQVRFHRRVVDKYGSFAFVTAFAQRLLLQEEHRDFSRTLVKAARTHFADVGESILRSIGTCTVESTFAYDALEFYELNFLNLIRDHGERRAVTSTDFFGPYVSDIGRVASAFATILFFAGRPCEQVAMRGLEMVLGIKDRLGEAHLKKLLGVVHAGRKGDLTLAKKFFGEALVLYKSASNGWGQGLVYNALGSVHAKLQNFHGALRCYTRAVPYFERLHDERALQNCYRWMATLSKKLGDKAKSLEHFQRANHIASEMNMRRNRRREPERWNGTDLSLHLQLPPPAAAGGGGAGGAERKEDGVGGLTSSSSLSSSLSSSSYMSRSMAEEESVERARKLFTSRRKTQRLSRLQMAMADSAIQEVENEDMDVSEGKGGLTAEDLERIPFLTHPLGRTEDWDEVLSSASTTTACSSLSNLSLEEAQPQYAPKKTQKKSKPKKAKKTTTTTTNSSSRRRPKKKPLLLKDLIELEKRKQHLSVAAEQDL